MAIINPTSRDAKPKQLLKTLGIVALLSGICLANVATAAVLEPAPTHSVTLAWDPVVEPVLTGYKLFLGTSPGQYTEVHEVDLSTQLTVSGLEFGQTYYAVVISLGAGADESLPSTELSFTVAPPPLPFDTQVALDGSGQMVLQWSFAKAALGSSPEFIIQASPDLTHWTEFETISADQPAVEAGDILTFVRPVATTGGPQMFYRMTARNWMGESTAP
jgi:hypothetical protein